MQHHRTNRSNRVMCSAVVLAVAAALSACDSGEAAPASAETTVADTPSTVAPVDVSTAATTAAPEVTVADEPTATTVADSADVDTPDTTSPGERVAFA